MRARKAANYLVAWGVVWTVAWGAACERPAGSLGEPIRPDDHPASQALAAVPAEAPPGPALTPITRGCDEAALAAQGFRDAGADVNDLRVEQGALRFVLQHGGGCAAHRYQVCWSGDVARTEPPQASLSVWHHPNGDQCEAMLTQPFVIQEPALEGVVISIRHSSASPVLYPKPKP